MAGLRSVAPIALSFLSAAIMVAADRRMKHEGIAGDISPDSGPDLLIIKLARFLWRPDDSSYQHVWPVNYSQSQISSS